ncbi:MAG: D-erythronate dehydrogenase [Pseudomonadota bacterium]
MHVMIIGAAGMVGRKLMQALVASGKLGETSVTKLTLADVIEPPEPEGFAGTVSRQAIDLSNPGVAPMLVASKPEVIIHLAAIVSGEAETDFEKGYRVNFDGTRALFEAIRLEHMASGYCPRVVFTSSIGVFGAPFPETIEDDFFLTPLTSYGTQKVVGELLLSDYTRRGFFDGVGIRLPTICIRPGKPNKAASGFFSGILREPLAGLPALLPVEDDVRHWHASPRAAVGFLTHAATMETSHIGDQRNLTMPGISATVAEQIDALRRIAGDKVVALIKREPDPAIVKIVEGWPRRFNPQRALDLGFRAESTFDEIIRIHIEDELEGRIA